MRTVNSPVEVYTDGACKGNPGSGGFAYIIKAEFEHDDTETKEDIISYSEGYEKTTNNRMEIMAVLKSMEKVADLVKFDPAWEYVTQMNVYTDSRYVSDSINKRWVDSWNRNGWIAKTSGQPTKNRDLWEKFLANKEMLTAINVVFIISWLKGHSDSEYNNMADELAVQASEQEDKLIDEYYQNLKSREYC